MEGRKVACTRIYGIINIPNKEEALMALRSCVINLSRDEACDTINSAPGVVMRGVWTPYAKQIQEALSKIGVKVILE